MDPFSHMVDVLTVEEKRFVVETSKRDALVEIIKERGRIELTELGRMVGLTSNHAWGLLTHDIVRGSLKVTKKTYAKWGVPPPKSRPRRLIKRPDRLMVLAALDAYQGMLNTRELSQRTGVPRERLSNVILPQLLKSGHVVRAPGVGRRVEWVGD